MAAAVDDVDLERDRNLVLRAQAGDELAFASLYTRYQQRLIRFAARRVGNRADAEEIAQEAFARAYRALPDFGEERRFYSWLSVITARLCIDSLRRSWRVEVGDIAEEPVIETGFDRIERADDMARVQDALERISPRHREVLELREREGWAYQRIADHYNVSLGTVEALLWRARRALKREYEALGSFLLGIPVLRRLFASRFGDTPHGVATITALGTVAALGLAGTLGAAGADATAAAVAGPVLHVAAFHSSPSAAPSAPASEASPAAAGGPPAVVVSAAPGAPPSSVPGGIRPLRIMNGPDSEQAVDSQQIVVHLGLLNVGVSPANVGPDLEDNYIKPALDMGKGSK